MIPLIEIEQFSYNAIVPDKLRMPPPVPPSQRLLSALDEFYSASLDPAREPPLVAWGRGGCNEFMERKQSLKKILEEKLKSENKTISDLVENKPSEEELKIAQDDINAEIKRKYEEMRRNALANEEKEKRNSSSPQSPKRKDRGRSKDVKSYFSTGVTAAVHPPLLLHGHPGRVHRLRQDPAHPHVIVHKAAHILPEEGRIFRKLLPCYFLIIVHEHGLDLDRALCLLVIDLHSAQGIAHRLRHHLVTHHGFECPQLHFL
ncbi:hypothetical protein ANCCAN_28900, partial [Ancylostoma caninum]